MRVLWLLLLCVFFMREDVLAQSQLRVSLTDRSRITVAVDGRYFNRRGTAITVGDLPPGRHSLKIYAVQRDRWGSPYQRVIFQGRVTTEYRMTTNVVYNPHNRMAKIRQLSDDFRTGDPGDDYAAYKEGREEEEVPARATAPATGVAASPATMGSLSENKQEALKKKVDAEKTDTKKLLVAKGGLTGETLSTMQIISICNWFLFESTKLEFAKWAYNVTVDKQSYSDIASVFDGGSYKQEFTDFVRQQR